VSCSSDIRNTGFLLHCLGFVCFQMMWFWLILVCLTTHFQVLDYIAWDGRMIYGWWIEKDVKGNDHDLFWKPKLSRRFPRGTKENHTKTSFGIIELAPSVFHTGNEKLSNHWQIYWEETFLWMSLNLQCNKWRT